MNRRQFLKGLAIAMAAPKLLPDLLAKSELLIMSTGYPAKGGFLLDHTGFHVGNMTTNGLCWDGTDLYVVGDMVVDGDISMVCVDAN